MERKDRLIPNQLHDLTQTMQKLALNCTVILERHGILKHKLTIEELEAAELRSRILTADYLESRINLDTYREELDKLPRLDLRQLAQDLHSKD